MSIRLKLLILLLCLTLAPVIVLGVNGQKTMVLLRGELVERSRGALAEQARGALLRLVEDHARLFKRERELLEAVLQLQAVGLTTPDSLSLLPADPGPIDPDLYCARLGSGVCRPLDVRLDAAGLLEAGPMGEMMQRGMGRSGMGPPRAGLEKSRLAAYRFCRRRLGGFSLWQTSLLPDGKVEAYPAPAAPPGGHMAAQVLHDLMADAPPGVSWKGPFIDPLTRKPVMAVVAPIRDREDEEPLATALLTPVQALFHVQVHLPKISPDVSAFLITLRDGAVEIVAEAQMGGAPRHGRWMMMDQSRDIPSRDPAFLAPLAEPLGGGESAVESLVFDGRPSLAAAAPVGAENLSLLILAPEADVTARAQELGGFVQSSMNEQIRASGWMVVVVLVLAALAAIISSRSITSRLTRVAAAAESLGCGNFEAKANVPGGDEVARLGQAVDRMVPALREQVRMREGLQVAMQVQQSLLPKTPPEIPGLDLAGVIVYCDETGGDFYDYIRRGSKEAGDARLLCVVGDVSGHGISAALLMASCRSAMRSRAASPGGPAEIADHVNKLLAADSEPTGQFVTAFLLEVDPKTGAMAFVRAGHEPALALDRATGRVELFKGPGMALGAMPDAPFTDQPVENGVGSTVVLATDGVTEARNSVGEIYGRERMMAALRDCRELSARQTMDALLDDLNRFTDGVRHEDDVTLVVVRL